MSPLFYIRKMLRVLFCLGGFPFEPRDDFGYQWNSNWFGWLYLALSYLTVFVTFR